MSYHRGGQAGAVAVSYSTSPMVPHSPSRRYSSGTAGTTTTSGIGSSTSKFSTYHRSTGGTSSILDQPAGSFYTPSSTAGSSLRSNYISSEYRRSYCAPGSFYSSTATLTSIRRNYSSEYSRSNRSPARSVSSSSYGETGGSSATGVVANGTGRCSTSSTSSASSSRERNVDTAADIISRYSPASYVPNIRHQSTGSGSHHWKHRSSASSSLSELFGGDEREVVERRVDRPESSLSSSSSASSAAAASGGGLWSRSAKRRPPTSSSTVLTTGHARADSAASLAEVTIDDHVSCKTLDDGHDDGDVITTKDVINGDDDQHNNNNNGNNLGNGAHVVDGKGGGEGACRFGVNNNDDGRDRDDKRDDDDDDGDGDDENDDDDVDDDDDNNRNNRHRNRQPQQHHHHHHLRQQRSRRPDEVSPAKRNLLSPTGGGGLIGVSLDLLTNLATNPRNSELLINNNAQDKKATRGEEAAIANNDDEVIRAAAASVNNDDDDDAATSIDAITTFLQGGRSAASERDIPEDGDEEQGRRRAYNVAESGFGAAITATLPVVQNSVSRSLVTHGDEPSSSVPSTSRRADQSGCGLFSAGATNNTAGNLTSSPTTNATSHHSLYRGGSEQYVSAFVTKSGRRFHADDNGDGSASSTDRRDNSRRRIIGGLGVFSS